MNHIIWVDIPVTDMERAREFYSQMLGLEIDVMPGMSNVAVPSPGQGNERIVSFDLYVASGDRAPGPLGPTIYFDAQGRIEDLIRHAEAAGGSLIQEPRDEGPMIGVIAFVQDTEGNVIGLRQASPQE